MHSTQSNTQFNWMVRVYYEDTDAGGIVFYANYLKFFERARTELLRALHVNQFQMREMHQAVFVVKASALEYHAPARLDDELCISTELKKIGGASLVFDQIAWLGELKLVSATVTICCVDSVEWKAMKTPEMVLEKLRPLLSV